MKTFALITLIVILLGVFPLATIASLNTLFGLGIEYSVPTLLSTLWLSGVVGGSAYASKK
jgi:hypothetical protein